MQRLVVFIPLLLVLLTGGTQAHADICNGFSTNLVSNCGFESGSFSSWSGTATAVSSSFAGVDSGDVFTTASTPYSGRYEAYLGFPGGTVALTQTLSTVSNYSYLIEFALLNDTGPASPYTNSFAVLFDGNTVFSESAVAAGAYTLYKVAGISSSNASTLSFVSRNDGGFFELDSVSVTVAATPEPSTWLLLSTGLIGVAGVVRRRAA